MEAIECIKTRRSRRLFNGEEVSEEIIKELIECAINAPSSMDCQPWHFIIVRDEETKKKLAVLKEENNKEHISTSSILVIVCVDTEKSSSRWIEDGITATENLLLATHALGLGAVYVTGFSLTKPEVAKEIREILNLPENITPVTIIPIGYPNSEEKLEEKHLRKLNEVIHYDKW